MHLLACKGVLSATPNAKDMTSDAWDCLGTRILGSLWLGSYDLMKGMMGFLAKRARLRVVEGVTKNSIHAWKLTSIDLSTRRYHEKNPFQGVQVFVHHHIFSNCSCWLADLLTFLGPKKNPKWLNDSKTTMNLQQLQLKIPQKQHQHQIQNLQNLSTQQC